MRHIFSHDDASFEEFEGGADGLRPDDEHACEIPPRVGTAVSPPPQAGYMYLTTGATELLKTLATTASYVYSGFH
jgi:hypothetical protein